MKTIVKQIEGAEVPTEIIAQALIDIGAAMRKLRSTRLTERALIILIQNAAGNTVTQTQIRTVLGAIEDLERLYVKKETR